MKEITQRFVTWLMGLTRIMRYFVIAVMVHAGLILLLASIKIVTVLPKIVAKFDSAAPPPPLEAEPDPTAAYRNFEYNGPTLGGGGGTPGKGPGGIPTAAGNTPTEYKASIMTSDTKASDSSVGEVIGVVSDIGAAIRPQGSPGGGIAAPTTGLGEGLIGTSGVKGPGGGGFGQRVGPVRSQLLKKYKRSAETERAVLAALKWLKDHQREDGSWECATSVNAGTALAVLAFLGHGETPESEMFGNAVNKGLKFLIKCIGNEGFVSDGNAYAQGAVTLALSEAYGMTQSAAVREPLERAVNAIVQWQKNPKKDGHHRGGWRYSRNADDADTSVSGWMIMALKSAKLAGIKVPEEAFESASKYLWAMYGNSSFGYSTPGSGSPANSAIGVLCQQFLGHGDDPRIKKALDKLKENKPEWDKTELGWVLYFWYYQTQAMFQGGGSYWEHWNKEISDAMLKNQSEDGHWECPPRSGELKSLNKTPAYATAIGCLILEVYYRYLPLMKELEKPGSGAAPGAPAPPAK